MRRFFKTFKNRIKWKRANKTKPFHRLTLKQLRVGNMKKKSDEADARLMAQCIVPAENTDSDVEDEIVSLDDGEDSDYSQGDDDYSVDGQAQDYESPGMTMHSPRDVVVKKLVDSSFNSFLQNSTGVGGGRSVLQSTLIARRFAECICDVYHELYGQQITENADIFAFLKAFITEHYDEVAGYVERRQKSDGFKPKTIINHLDSVLEGVKWFSLYRPSRHEYNVTSAGMVGLEILCTRIKAAARRRDKGRRAENTIERAIYNRRAPVNGLPELAAAVDTEIQKVIPAIRAAMKESDSSPVRISREFYNRFMRVTYSGLYTGASQGRVGGVQDLRYGQRRELLTQGHASTGAFKTSPTYMFQPITLPHKVKKLIRLYLKVLRPMVCGGIEPNDNDFLFLAFNGQPETKAGSKVSEFFSKSIGIWITTTMIRALVETEADDAHDAGDISPSAKASIHFINGHSASTAKAFYVKKSIGKQIERSREFFQARELDLSSEQVVDSDEDSEHDGLFTPRARQAPWGQNHPCQDMHCERVPFSKRELQHIGKEYRRIIAHNPACKNVLKLMLDAIKADDEMMKDFHPRHIHNTTRLTPGLKTWKQQQARR